MYLNGLCRWCPSWCYFNRNWEVINLLDFVLKSPAPSKLAILSPNIQAVTEGIDLCLIILPLNKSNHSYNFSLVVQYGLVWFGLTALVHYQAPVAMDFVCNAFPESHNAEYMILGQRRRGLDRYLKQSNRMIMMIGWGLKASSQKAAIDANSMRR